MRPMAGWAVMACAGLLGALPAAAQEASEGDLRKEVEALKAKVEALEAEKKVEPAPKEEAQLMKLDDDRTILDILADETTLHGFVDTGFIFNLDRPLSPDSNIVMPFTNDPRNFYLHNAQLNIARAPTKELITGYEIRLMFGSDANFAGTLDEELDDYFSIQQANIQILAPVGEGILFTVGKFATLAGYEVIESKDNYNYTRSLPFYFTIPFTHTGVRAAYQFTEQVKVTAGVNNGWDLMNDNNDGKTFEFQLAVVPVTWLSLYGNFYYGQELAPTASGRNPGNDRMLFDFVAVAADIPGLEGFKFGVNVTIGEEEETSVVNPGDDAEWLGFAVYGRYQINDDYALAVRYSMVSDDEGARVNAPSIENDYSEITVTLERRISKDTIARLEVRHDMSDEDVFFDHASANDSQTVLGAEFILTF